MLSHQRNVLGKNYDSIVEYEKVLTIERRLGTWLCFDQNKEDNTIGGKNEMTTSAYSIQGVSL